jgi:hypothetical protein
VIALDSGHTQPIAGRAGGLAWPGAREAGWAAVPLRLLSLSGLWNDQGAEGWTAIRCEAIGRDPRELDSAFRKVWGDRALRE